MTFGRILQKRSQTAVLDNSTWSHCRTSAEAWWICLAFWDRSGRTLAWPTLTRTRDWTTSCSTQRTSGSRTSPSTTRKYSVVLQNFPDKMYLRQCVMLCNFTAIWTTKSRQWGWVLYLVFCSILSFIFDDGLGWGWLSLLLQHYYVAMVFHVEWDWRARNKLRESWCIVLFCTGWVKNERRSHNQASKLNEIVKK